MKRVIKNNIGEIISFILTISIFLVVLGISGLFDKSIMISDLKAQMYPLLEHIKSASFALYDFSLGIGDNVLGLIYYYLLSPFNLLSLFITVYFLSKKVYNIDERTIKNIKETSI